MTPVYRIVYHTLDNVMVQSRIACEKHIAARSHEILEHVIDESWDSDLFCKMCENGE